MSADTVPNVDSGALQHGTRGRNNSGTEYDASAGTEVAGTLFRNEYPPVCGAPPFPLHAAGPCSSFYGAPGQIGYSDCPDRYSVGYQRMGQTITLTSHKIQFGCQSGRPYGQQRFGAPGYNTQYQMMQQHLPGKPWSDVSIDRANASHSSKPNNRGRTTYSDEQIAELESVFNTNPYPTSQTRQHLAYKIDVPEGKVKIWFQNRRARAKKSKLGCGGGSWRPSHHDSRHCDDSTNQNNNNAKECFKTEPPPISINSILPLPTKNTINKLGASNWNSASSSNSWRSQFDTHGFRPCMSHGHSSSQGYQCPPDTSNCRNLKPWNWSLNVNNQPHAYRANQSSENSEIKEQVRRTARSPTPWNYTGAVGNVPDLINQTSKVGIIGVNPGAEGDLKVGDDGGIHSRTLGETDRSLTGHPFNISMSAGGLVCHEKRQSYFAEELSSPPPIRRLIFPFHTLTEAKSTTGENTVSAPSTSESVAFSRIGDYVRFSSATQEEGATFNATYGAPSYTKSTSLTGNYQAVSQSSSELGSFTQMQRADNKWEVSAVKIGDPIPEIEKNAEVDSSPRTQARDDEEDDDATDDAFDEPGMNDCATVDDGNESANKPNYPLPAGQSEPYISSYWSNRPDSNILVKAMEFVGEQSLDGKQVEDSMVGRLTNLHGDMSQPVDASGIWSNQFVSSMYPPSSASMVG